MILLSDGTRRKRTVNIPVSGKGVFRYIEFIKACGFDSVAASYEAKNPEPFDITSFIGCKLRVRVEAAVYDNKPSDEIKGYYKAA